MPVKELNEKFIRCAKTLVFTEIRIKTVTANVLIALLMANRFNDHGPSGYRDSRPS